ncbi:MAG: selenocysteine-specific translation elongation factor [Caldilineales bacterium]
MKVIGTAGHVDHGKSSLVLALTGIDPDRLAEEKARAMTIDLGFAWLTLGPTDSEMVGVVDVPGHIDFIKNMLAGVGGIDAALFVIAADEGVMPQTREHLAILDLLEVRHGVVALSKADLVARDPDWLTLVQADVAETLAATSLAGAPIVPVSVRTGQGLNELRAALAAVLAQTPPRRNIAKPRLPIDRAFSIAGFGTVVTGTLSDGELLPGQEVELLPDGLRSRIRGLQTHKQKVERAEPGSRVAVNLGGISKEQVQRGQVLALPGTLRATTLVDVRLRLVQSGPTKPLLHNQAVDFFCGAAETAARVRLLDAEALEPGQSGWVQLRLATPVALAHGDRFILRQPSPSRTLAGGMVVNAHPGRRWRRFRAEVITTLEALQNGEPPDLLLHALQRSEPSAFATLAASAGLDAHHAAQALNELLAAGQVLVLDRDNTPATAQTVLSAAGWQTLITRLQSLLAGYHRHNPLRLGMVREELRSRWQDKRQQWSPRQFNDLLAYAIQQGLATEEAGLVRLPDHQVRLALKQQTAADTLLTRFAAQPAQPPSPAECSAAVGDDLLQWLLDSGRLLRLADDVIFETAAYQRIVQQIVARLQANGSITVAQVRDEINTSRKYALALMEHLDAQRITRRVGDVRVLRSAAADV